MADISLTASMRSNLLSLQNTQSLMDTTQERLSTGKKVNSAIDNPSSYYTARSLTNRASDLSALLDSMGQGISTIKAANEGIESITSFVEQAKALINSALETSASTLDDGVTSTGTFAATAAADADVTLKVTVNGVEKDVTVSDVGTTTAEDDRTIDTLVTKINAGLTTAGLNTTITATKTDDGQVVLQSSNKEETVVVSGTINGLTFDGTQKAAVPNDRTSAQAQYNEVLRQIDMMAKDSGYKGVNLLQSENLTVNFNEDRSSSLTVNGKSADSAGLGLVEAANWDTADNVALNDALDAVDGAINNLRNWAAEFGNNFSVLQNREDFTEKLINVLTEGSDKLTLADMNEESANMLALQTRQQLAINSLSLASQAAQSVLKLF